ncbi:MAG TPA: hypothetical protein PL001_05405 [Candidatus Kryptobacter bacterium]|nr:hypothetical protein [Candidatus Kryptobacter bacterium]
MELKEMQALADRMRIEQPFAMVYLLAITQREGFTDQEIEIFFFVGTVIWQLMRENPNGKRKITERDLHKAEEANEALLEKMAADSEGDFLSAAETVALDSPEPEVFRYIVQAIMEDDEGNPDNPPFSEEHLGAAFLHLKVVLDAFIANQKRG